MIDRVDSRPILRNPVSLLLAGALAVSAIACSGEAQASSAPKPKCPTTPAEVSLLVGGDPTNWNPIEGIKGSWRFRSEVDQVLNGARIGRIDTPTAGRINPVYIQRATEAWYVCVENAGVAEPISQEPQQ